MSEDSSFSNYPSYGEKNFHKSHFVAFFFIILIIVIIILVGLYFLGASKKGSFNPLAPANKTVTPVPSGKPSPTLTPTPVALERSELEIAVLNGSGVAGAAKDISSHLEDLGYTIKRVTNASKFDYQDVTILITKDKSEYLEMLKKDLAGKASNIETEIDEDLTIDAEVIVGK
jgi:hypothetical protein